MKRKKLMQRAFLLSGVVALAATQTGIVWAAGDSTDGTTPSVFINEIESDDANGGNDWIEIMNAGSEDVDLSGWFVTDDKGLERLSAGETTPLPQGTILPAGAVLVLEDGSNFDFGLGKEDQVTLYNSSSEAVDSYQWSGHAAGTYSRVPDGTGEFTDQQATKGALNIVTESPGEGKLVINEINSSPDDWVELMNTGEQTLDLSGYEIRDNSDDHRFRLPEGTELAPGELLLIDSHTAGEVYNDQTDSYESGEMQDAIGIGSGDSIRLYDKDGSLLDEYSWTSHASYNEDESAASYGRYPDGTGSFVVMPETPGEANSWYSPQVVINEVESNGDATDWVEIYNAGTSSVDISGWYMLDNDPVGHATDVTPVAEGTILEPGAYYVFDQNKDFTFGLGDNDQATIFNKDGAVVAEYTWTSHAQGVYARIPDGTGELIDFATSTKGEANIETNPVVINEVQSNDPDNGPDWIELANPTDADLDISGIVIKDDDDSHEYTIPEGTVIPANGYLVITEDDFGFGLGKNDQVRLFEDGRLIASTTWPDHTSPTWGLFPDAHGNEYRNTLTATPGAANEFSGLPETIAWPGNQEITIFDTEPTFYEDSSGLDFYNGQLYAVDNGTGTFWILDVAQDGTLSFADGFENGKRVRFQKDANDPSAPGPDAEGITVDQNGLVYIASERDNDNKGINYNSILMVDPSAAGTDLVALAEWDLTDSLPQVAANTGIEAVEWIANEDVEGKLIDQNTQTPFDASAYPDAIADGLFFVALEDNGHVYAYVLNEDGSCVQIADMNPGLGGAMALDYDTYENVLWVVTDNGYGNMAAKVQLNGTDTPDVTYVNPPSGLDISQNNEGFAIAEAGYTVNGQRPVYRFQDGVTSGALSIGSLACDYTSDTDTPQDPGTTPGTDNPQDPGTVPGTDDPQDPGTAPGSGNDDPQNPGNVSGTGNGNSGQTGLQQTGTNTPATGANGTHTSQSRTPATGDSQPLAVSLLLAAGSMGIIATVVYRRRKTS